ncbi:MAG: class I SAM-dependent methyltransferase [Acidimicrobiales bacterium]
MTAVRPPSGSPARPARGGLARGGLARGGLARGVGILHQRRVWTRRAVSWDHADNPSLDRVVAAILALAGCHAGMSAVDLGAGSGQLTIPLARRVGHVLALDISPAMVDLLRANAASAGVTNIETRVGPIEGIDLPPASVDLVVSNYALHHLRDPDKARAVRTAVTWLRPDGRVVIGDMMFGRGASARDRAIIASKATSLLRRGPGGWWRVGKNAVRFLARVQERPLAVGRWVELLLEAGLSPVSAAPVVAEAAIVSGTLPPADPAPPGM